MDEGTAALGIDFGTSHTVAALRHGSGRVEPLLFDASPLLPSAVYADPGGRLLTGADATRGGRLDPAGVEPNPKRRVDDGILLLGDHEVPIVDAVAAVLGRVAGEAARALGRPADRTVLTHPAEWAAPRCAVLRAAAGRAGLDPVVLTPEPVAAAAYFTGQLGRVVEPGTALVVYDFGAGTFDVSVLTRTDENGWRVRASAGFDDVGGLDIDATIVGWLGRGVGLRDPSSWHRLTHPATAQDLRHRRQLWDEARTAKEQLGRGTRATLSVPGAGADIHLTREEFDALAQPLLDRTVRLTLRTMDASGVGPDRMAGVFLVGGSSRIPLVATLLHRSLGFAPTVLEQPELVVAYGSLTEAATAGPEVVTGPAAEPVATTAQPVATAAEPVAAVADPAPSAPAVPPAGAARGRASVPVSPPPAGPAAGTTPDPPPESLEPVEPQEPPNLRRVAWVVGVLGAVALVVAFAAVPASRTALLAGARLPVAPGALLPFLAAVVLLASTGTPARPPGLRRIAGIAVLVAAGAVLPPTAAALAARLAGHRFKLLFAPETAPVIPFIRLASGFLWLGVVAGLCVTGAGLWLLARGRRADPLAGSGRRLTAALTGAVLGGLSLTLMYGGLMFFLGGWHWGESDDDVSNVPFLLDQVFWATPARGAQVWLGYLAGVAVAVGVACLVAVGARRLLHRAAPAVRDASWQAGAVLLFVGGAFAAFHAGAEWWHWYQLSVVDEPKSGPLLWVHNAWQATVGLVSPTVYTFVLVVVGGALLLRYARRRPATPAGRDPR